MIAFLRHDARNLSNEWADLDTFEPMRRPRRSEFPARSSVSQTRARQRSRGRAAARLKARAFNGAHRRGRGAWSSRVAD